MISRASTYVALMCMSFSSLILHCNWIWWWWYNARSYLSTISPSMHVMIYVLTYSRTSKGLSLGELIRAFYIIIYTSHIIILECYMHCYINVLHVLDDLWVFHTKSLFLAFNIWEEEYPFVLLLWCGLDPYHGTRGTPVETLGNTIITYNDT